MNANEKRIRLTCIAERIQQLEGELIVLVDSTYADTRLMSAATLLSKAAETILDEPTPRASLETALRLSIAHEMEKLERRKALVVKFPEGA